MKNLSISTSDIIKNRNKIGCVLFLTTIIYYFEPPRCCIITILYILNIYDSLQIFDLFWDYRFRIQEIACNMNNLFIFIFYFTTEMISLNQILKEYNGVTKTLQIVIITISYEVFQHVFRKVYIKTLVRGPSPNKTIEGCLGIIPSCVIVNWYIEQLLPESIIIICILVDLLVSYCKRDLKIKGKYQLLGSHGAWLNRVAGICLGWIYYRTFIRL